MLFFRESRFCLAINHETSLACSPMSGVFGACDRKGLVWKMSSDLAVQEALTLHLQGHSIRAAKMLEELATQGVGHAAHELGVLYMTGGPDLPVDRQAGMKWLEKSVELGFAETIATDPNWFRIVRS